jgi:hypothetical protein
VERVGEEVLCGSRVAGHGCHRPVERGVVRGVVTEAVSVVRVTGSGPRVLCGSRGP